MSGWLANAFLSPVFLWFLALIPVIVLLYLLKLRRTEIIISSTFLWLKSLQDLTANAPFQKLRRNLLLLLQIIIVMLLTAALARPFIRSEGSRGKSFCVMIDKSASMQTRENGGTRLDEAKQVALDMVANLGRGDRMMVVAFAESADVLCELTEDRYRIRRAINSITAADTRSNIRDALQVARSLSPDNPDVESVVADLEVVLLSDGRITDIAEVGARAMALTYRRVGATRDNAGIAGFSVRKSTENAGQQQTFVLVHNESDREIDSTLTLFFEDTALAVEEVHVAAQNDAEVLFEHADLGEGVLRVELDHDDALPLDNRAWLSLRPATRLRTLVVSQGESTSGYFLKRALALEPRVELSSIDPLSYAVSQDFDLIIFDGFAPEELPQGTLLFINAVPPGIGVGVETPPIARPTVLGRDTEHPVMRFLRPENVGIQEAQRLTLPAGSRVLLSTEGGPLIADVSRGGRQMIVVAFDIARSDWAANLSFPLFIQNLVSWAPKGAIGNEMSTQTGKPIAVMPAQDVTTATITTPGGAAQQIALDPLRPVFFGATSTAGVYTVRRGDEVQRFAVNLLDREESSIAPADTIQLGRAEVQAQTGPIRTTRELWRWFVLGALAVLSIEWWIYSRRAWL